MDDDKAAAAQRILLAGEDPSLWFGVRIGQRWQRSGSLSFVFVSDLQMIDGKACVFLQNVAGHSLGKIGLESFTSTYQHTPL